MCTTNANYQLIVMRRRGLCAEFLLCAAGVVFPLHHRHHWRREEMLNSARRGDGPELRFLSLDTLSDSRDTANDINAPPVHRFLVTIAVCSPSFRTRPARHRFPFPFSNLTSERATLRPQVSCVRPGGAYHGRFRINMVLTLHVCRLWCLI